MVSLKNQIIMHSKGRNNSNDTNKSMKICSSFSIGILCVVGFWIVIIVHFHSNESHSYLSGGEQKASIAVSSAAVVGSGAGAETGSTTNGHALAVAKEAAAAAASSYRQSKNASPAKQDKKKLPSLKIEPSVVANKLPPVETETKKSKEPAVQQQQEEPELHIVFSTDCTFFQDWQTLLMYHSATVVGQKGSMTRIASGCTEEKKTELTNLYKKLYPQFHVHFTPDFKKDEKSGESYDFYNKPYGVHHWLQHAEPAVTSGTVVAILDPDMILLRPLTAKLANEPQNLYLKSHAKEKDEIPQYIGRGHPAAQLYGLGAPWTNDKSKEFNRTEACGVGSPCLKVNSEYGKAHYSVGPPYIVERDDLVRLTTAWTAMVPTVYGRYPDLLSEMYAYSMAAAHVNLPHTSMLHYMVSNTHMDEEGWPWIDVLEDDVCIPPDSKGIFYPDKQLPTVLHFCQFFRAGELGFQKRRIRKQIFDCDRPMMQEPPSNLGTLDYKNRDGTNMTLTRKQCRRNAFMLCTLHRAINSMLLDYKERMCPPAFNTNKTINVVAKAYWGW